MLATVWLAIHWHLIDACVGFRLGFSGGKAPGAIVAETKKFTMLGRFLLLEGWLGFLLTAAKTIALL